MFSQILFPSYGQTQLDKEIFRVVNEYRISNGLNVWVWNQDLFKVSEKHNYYQTQIKNVTHDESIDIKDHVEVRRLGDRVSEGVGSNWGCVGENLARVHSKDLTIKEIAERVINGWSGRVLLRMVVYLDGCRLDRWSINRNRHRCLDSFHGKNQTCRFARCFSGYR